MKKLIIGSLIGSIILFIVQFTFWAGSNLHQKSNQYTNKQDTVLQFLQKNLHNGTYLLPNAPPNSTNEEKMLLGENMKGKPWAIVTFHEKYSINMLANIGRSLLVDFCVLFFIMLVLINLKSNKFFLIFFVSILVGLIGFLDGIYTFHIWYPGYDIMMYFYKTLCEWAFIGIWLGFYIRKK